MKDDKQKIGLRMADLALLTFAPARAGVLYERLMAGDPPFQKPTADVESYLLFRMGQALEFQDKHDDAVVCLKRLYGPKYSKYPWTGDGIYRLGTWSFNHTQDYAQAGKHWEYVATNFPKHKEAERALFFYAYFADIKSKDYKKAIVGYRKYLSRYPSGRWTKRISETLLPKAQKLVNTKG